MKHLFTLALIFSFSAFAANEKPECPKVDHTHAAFDKILKEHVKDGKVDYKELKKEGERKELGAYLKMLEGACDKDYKTWSDEQKLAYWINAYNAYTIELILDNYPLKSIRSIGWLPMAAFRKNFIPTTLFDKSYLSLNHIEHEILRKDFKEPRIHFAIVCASKSCPKLQSFAYRAEKLESQLDNSAREFLNDKEKNRFDAEAHTLYLSSIFSWFKEDFGDDNKALIRFAGKYVPAIRDARDEKPKEKIIVKFLDYDWALNE